MAVIVFHVALMLFGWGFLAVERAGVGIRRTGDCAAVPIGVDSGGGTIESEGK